HSGRESNWRGSKLPRPGVQDDQAENRVKDMDDEGTDVHFLIPSSWVGAVGLADPSLEVGLSRAYHRHMADFCGQFPNRLKGLIRAPARDVDAAVQEIREWGNSTWAVAVQPSLGQDIPADHPDLEPIWRAAADHDLPIVHHSSTWNPPYYPGYLDVWGQHLPRPTGLASLGRDAVCRLVHRRRDLRPLSEPQDGRARMRLWLAALLGPPHGRAIRLCRLDRRIEDEAEPLHDQRPLLLQHRAAGGRGHVQHRHRFSRR